MPSVDAHEVASSEPMEDLITVLDRVQQWSSDGTFDNVDRLLRFVNALMDSATTETIVHLMKVVTPLAELADRLLTSDIGQRLPDLLDAMDDLQQHPVPYQKHEIRHLMQALRDPETQMGINYALELLRKLAPILSSAPTTPKA